MFKKYFSLNKLSTLLLYLFIIAFNFSDNRNGGWYQQFLPDSNGASLQDIASPFTKFALKFLIANLLFFYKYLHFKIIIN